MTDHSIEGKTAVIAGGGRNLGALIASQFVQAGARGIVIHYNSNSSKADAQKTVAKLKALGADAILFQGDLSVVANNVKRFDQAREHFGKADIAINTAGVVIKKPIADVTEADYEKSFAANSKAAFFFIQQAGRVLEERGSIVTIVSSLLAAYTPLFYGQETAESTAYNKAGAAQQVFQNRPDRHRGHRTERRKLRSMLRVEHGIDSGSALRRPAPARPGRVGGGHARVPRCIDAGVAHLPPPQATLAPAQCVHRMACGPDAASP
ncbi:MAG TPA: SDR family NAD(P)-dependent oxidoreductase [Caldilinea sp.]|nr:SDR family NAD(P)-dependent oxidoreductase [Caldilinea sp.]